MLIKLFKLFSFVSVLSLLSPIPYVLANQPKPERYTQTLQQGEIPQGLTGNEWSSIQNQVKRAKYRLYPDERGGFYSANPAHGWKIHYAANGMTTLSPRSKTVKPYHLGMKLSAIGYQTMKTLNHPQSISQKDFTVSYQWNENLRERWINSDQQLEQWFVLEQKPEGSDKGLPLTLQMTLHSELNAQLNDKTLSFSDLAETNITYNKLKVWDANGKEISADMQLEGNTLSLLINDQFAQYPLTVDPSFTQQAYLKASNLETYDIFGWSVAVSGNTLVVGARDEDSNSVGVNSNQSNNSAGFSGAVYVFTRTGSTWSQQAYLKPSNTGGGDKFGYSVAISGNTLVVGAISEDSNSVGVNGSQSNNSASDSGAAYVFTRTGTTWSQQAYLKASNAETGDKFGYSVAIAGNTLVVGAYLEDSSSTGVNGNGQNNNLADSSGAAYVFTRAGATWSQQAYLKASNTGAGDDFGKSISISGNTIVVGAREEDSESTGVNGNQSNNLSTDSGAAYVFTRAGAIWSQQAYLKASNTDFEDAFGWSVAISGNTLVVGANYEESNSRGVNGDDSDFSASASGAAFVFIRTGSTWSQQAYLKASNTKADSEFGWSVAISGNTIVVGTQNEDSNSTGVNGNQSNNLAAGSGAAYVFTRAGSSWLQHAYLKASNTGAYDTFSWNVAISGDTLVVGAGREDSIGVDGSLSNLSPNSGAAYVFTTIPPHVLPNNQWHQVSLPMDPKAKNTVANVFGDDGLGTYNTNWRVFYYNINSNSYVKLALTNTLSPGVGYWIIQTTGSNKTLEMPIGSATISTALPAPAGCSSVSCFQIALGTQAATTQWQMIGYPYGTSQLFSKSRVHTNTAPCNSSGCTVLEAKDGSIFNNQLWSYNGSSYSVINANNNLEPWMGFWGATLNNSNGTTPSLLIPKPGILP
ncbi:MAG: FG-GAP repeat protein [Methylococcales bacterium]|nr:FG-GAP repeat protein [Methylococcales bacterium]